MKRLERWAKVWVLGADADGLSAASPPLYLARFNRKIRDILGTDAEGNRELPLSMS